MADKLFAGGTGGFGNMILPIGLGVAAAAHPAMARGAQTVAALMQNAQRNKRLQQAYEMEQKRYNLSEKRYNLEANDPRRKWAGFHKLPGEGYGGVKFGEGGVPQAVTLTEPYGPTYQKGKTEELDVYGRKRGMDVKAQQQQALFTHDLSKKLKTFDEEIRAGRQPSAEDILNLQLRFMKARDSVSGSMYMDPDLQKQQIDMLNSGIERLNQALPEKYRMPTAPQQPQPTKPFAPQDVALYQQALKSGNQAVIKVYEDQLMKAYGALPQVR